MRMIANIYWLGTKEVRSLFRDIVMISLIVWALGPGLMMRAAGIKETVNNASVAIVGEDRSQLSRSLRNVLTPPYFQQPVLIKSDDVDRVMDQSRYTFVIVIPPGFEADIRRGRRPEVQLNIDATAITLAATGAAYIQEMLMKAVGDYAQRADAVSFSTVNLVTRRAFNPNGVQVWFQAIVALLDQVSILTIALVGAALLREREHGTVEHLMVMPLTSFEIAMSKVLANGMVILIAFGVSMIVVVEYALDVPIAGSRPLLFLGASLYLFSAAAIGMFLGTVARTMAQFSLLMLMTIMPLLMLSGGMTPIESQPDWLQPITNILPSRHYMTFAHAVVFRGAGLHIVWPQLIAIAALGSIFLMASLLLFRRSITVAK